MRYSKIDRSDLVNGIGVHVSLWVSGCRVRCKGCHNSDLWSFDNGKEFDRKAMAELLELVKDPNIKGFSILGGEPLEPENKGTIGSIVRSVRVANPNIYIWLWTSHRFEDLDIYKDNYDVIIDGAYVDGLPTSKKYRGSDNQRFWKKNRDNGEWMVVD